jgi:phage terminase Nu1 subunit (DNA packaging protein)
VSTVGTSELATILGVSPRRIQQLSDENVLPSLSRGKWELPACVQAYVAYKMVTVRSELTGDETDEQLKAEKLRKLTAEADIREDLRDRQRAKLFHADDVIHVLGDCMSQIKAKILALPARLTLQLVGHKEPAVVNELLTGAVTELLNDIRTYKPEDFRSPDLPELIEQPEAVVAVEEGASEPE